METKSTLLIIKGSRASGTAILLPGLSMGGTPSQLSAGNMKKVAIMSTASSRSGTLSQI